MQTKLEHFAATSIMGAPDSPPRDNGILQFERYRESRAFGMALALSRHGHCGWEDFRVNLIGSSAEWEAEHAQDDPSRDYYQRWLQALERLLTEHALVDSAALESRTEGILTSLKCCDAGKK